MKTEVTEILGFDVEMKNIPTTIPEAVQLAGSEEHVLDNHIAYKKFHVHFSTVRKGLVEYLEEKTKILRYRKKEGDKEIIDEKDTAYCNRLRREHEELITQEMKDHIRTAWSEIDWTPGTRGGKLGNKWLSYYDQLKESGRLEEWCATQEIDVTQDEDVLKPLVATRIKAIFDEAAKAQEAALLGA